MSQFTAMSHRFIWASSWQKTQRSWSALRVSIRPSGSSSLGRIKPKQLIYIDDGNLILRVKSVSANSIKAVVVEGGVLKERKGINIPGVDLEFEGITPKDRKDIEFGVEQRIDYIALSFVRDQNDVRQASDLIKPRLPK